MRQPAPRFYVGNSQVGQKKVGFRMMNERFQKMICVYLFVWKHPAFNASRAADLG
jgi:hypothetical protein